MEKHSQQHQQDVMKAWREYFLARGVRKELIEELMNKGYQACRFTKQCFDEVEKNHGNR